MTEPCVTFSSFRHGISKRRTLYYEALDSDGYECIIHRYCVTVRLCLPGEHDKTKVYEAKVRSRFLAVAIGKYQRVSFALSSLLPVLLYHRLAFPREKLSGILFIVELFILCMRNSETFQPASVPT
ncbi:hypothetical protein M8J77_012103 [Diaphorina citri]|nr:hypothetical protein M8J77_012103 [Diaphorina citri]